VRRYWAIAVALVCVLLAGFILVEWLHVPLLTDPSARFRAAGAGAALLGIGLLLIDVVLPVPSSLVMTLHGTLFGVAGGMLLSTIGGVGAALTGFGLGRLGEPMLQRLLRPDERVRANAMLARWGVLAILLSRPVPLLAESVAILAGASPLRWSSAALAALAGTLPTALLYAWIGAEAARTRHFVLAFVVAMVVTATLWYGARLLRGYRTAAG